MISTIPQAFHHQVIERQPQLRFVVGADKTEIVTAQNLTLKSVQDWCKGLNANPHLVTQIVNCFLDSRYTWAIDPAGLTKLLEISVNTALDPGYLQKVVLNVGFGGSEEGVPLRAVSYVLPLLETVKSLQAVYPEVALPKIRFFTGQMMAAYCLGKDVNLLWTNTATLFALIQSFVDRFYPRLKDQLIFDFDRPINYGDLEQSLQKLRGVFSRRANSDPITEEALATLENMASGHGADLLRTPLKSALLYGAGHPTAFGDIDWEGTAHTSFLEKSRDRGVVMVGWGTRAETKFWRVRCALASQASQVLPKVTRRPWVMMFTQIGWDKPPYYRHPQGDLNWSAVLNWHRDWNGLPNSVKRELTLLAECVGGVDQLIDWVHSMHVHFSEVENTGLHAEELLAHVLLSSPPAQDDVKNTGLDPKDALSVATWAGSLATGDEKRIVELCRNHWMGI